MTLNPVAPLNARLPQWTFAERLRKARREIGWNQETMAERLEVKLSTYSAWETGRNKPDLADISPRLEALTGIDRLWFLGWDLSNRPGPDSPVTVPYRVSRKSHNWADNVTPIGGTFGNTSSKEGSGTQLERAA